MNYYKKYQKYKFKYLNLLNQSGGTIFADNFRAYLQDTYKNNKLVLQNTEKILTDLTKDGLLLKTINDKINMLEKYYAYCIIAVEQNGLALEHVKIPKKDNEYSLYYSVCKIAVEQNALALEHFKINEIKNALKEKYLSDYLNPILGRMDNKKHEEYKKEFLKINRNDILSFINEYINKNKKDIFEICKLAFTKNYLVFKYISKFVDDIIIDKKNYYEMCVLAVEKDGNALEHVSISNLPSKRDNEGDEPYDFICKLAVQQNGYALKHVPLFIIPIVLRQIMELAVRQNGLVLECINDNDRYKRAQLSDKKEILNSYGNIFYGSTYYEMICKEAVKQNGCALEFVDKEKMNDTEYKNICDLAVKQNPDAIKYIK